MRQFILSWICAVVMPAISARAGQLQVLCTTFPVGQITRNVAAGRENASVQLMLPAGLGCPHDYALTPADMRKLAGANVLVINGLGMEEFIGAPLTRANTNLALIDSSAGIEELLKYHGREYSDDHDHLPPAGAEDRHAGINPHLFASPRMAAALAENIAAGLARADPGGAALYQQNAAAYAARMRKLAEEFSALGKILKNNRIVQPHGVFDYLARDMGLEIVAVLQPHGQAPAAAEMLEVVKTIREKHAGAIFTEPQYSGQIGQTIARETGIPIATLDPGATGPESAPLDYYETVMRRNLEVLRATLGVKK